MSSLRFASWKEFFCNHADVDRLNNSADRLLQASHVNATANPMDRMKNVSQLPTVCTMAASSMPRHVWFAHSFHSIGNTVLDDPADIRHVALCGIGDNAEVCSIDINETFLNTSFDAPVSAELFKINNRDAFDAPASNLPNLKETVFFTGVICLPPFLFNDLAATQSFDTFTLYMETISSINSIIASFNDDTNDAIVARQQQFKRILQWLWAVNQRHLIPVSPIQPAPGRLEQAWKTQQHLLTIQPVQLPGSFATPPPSIAPPTGTFSTDPQLTLTMAKIADLFQQQYTDESKSKEMKEPSWSRFTSNAKTIILRAMTSDSTTAASDPTSTFLEFCNQRTAFTAHQHLLNFFESKGRARVAAPSQGMSSALYSGIIRAPTPGVPENLSLFFIPKKSPTQVTNISQHLIAQSLKSTEGSGLDTSEIKLATKQKIAIPTSYHEFLTQLENFQLLLEFIFGKTSLLYKQFFTVTTHVRQFEHEYEERINSHQWFIAKILSFVDRRIQLFLESCSTADSVDKINFTLINFDSLTQSVIDGTFAMDLPSIILNALEPLTKPHSNQPSNKKRTPEPNKGGEPSPKRSPPQRGEPAINASIHPPWRLQDGEDYVEHFVRRIDRLKLPSCDVCLNYHIRGTCHSLCARADTHKPAQSLSEQQKKSTTDFIKGARAQFAQQHNRPRPN